MKRLIIPAALCCLLTACGGAKTNNDSANTANTAAEAQEEVKVSDPYTMIDGKAFDLKDNVKKCQTVLYYSDENGNPSSAKPESDETIEFGPDGKYTKSTQYEIWKCFRNSDGTIQKHTWYCGDFGYDFVDSLGYNEAGFPVLNRCLDMGSCDYKLTYNDQNELVQKYNTAVYEEGQEGECTVTYKILDRDSHGNWTKRLLSIKDGSREMGEKEYQYELSTQVEIRNIEY